MTSLGPILIPPSVGSPHGPPQTTASPEDLFSESDLKGRPPNLSPSSSISTPIPASSNTSTSTSTSVTPKGSLQSTLSASIINHRPDLVSGPLSRSRSSSLRQVYPSTSQSITPPHSPKQLDPTTSKAGQIADPTLPSPRRQSNGYPPESSERARNPGLHGDARRNSQSRRVRSENLVPKSSPMAHGKRPSLVTGGYATTDSDTLSEGGDDENIKARPLQPRAASSFFSTRSTQIVAQDRRRRAQTLMLPITDDHSHSPDGEGSGSARSFGSSRTGRRRPDDILVPKGQRSRSSSLVRPPTATRQSQIRQNGGNNPARSPLSSNPSSRFPSAHFADSPPRSTRHFSHHNPRENTSRSPPQRTSDLPARTREVDRLRREEGVTSPEGSRKGKEKAHDPGPKRSGLVLSLLNASMSESPSLTSGKYSRNIDDTWKETDMSFRTTSSVAGRVRYWQSKSVARIQSSFVLPPS